MYNVVNNSAASSEKDPSKSSMNAQPMPQAFDYDEYYEETSVLPEWDDDDLDTVVEPESSGSMREFFGAHAKQLEPEQAQHSTFGGPAPVIEPQRVSPNPQHVTAEAPVGAHVAPPVSQQPAAQPAQQPSSAAPVQVAQPVQEHPAVEERHANVQTAKPVVERALSLTITRKNGDRCTLVKYPTVIGKGTDVDLLIPNNPAVSRRHACILRNGNIFAVEDLGSTNGTFVGSYRVPGASPTILTDGDELRLANEILHITIS